MPTMTKLLLFPKVPAPIDSIGHTITLRCGAEKYAMTISAKIERVTAQPRDIPSLDLQRSREHESYKPVRAPEGGDPDLTRLPGPSLLRPGAELSCLCSPGGVMNVITAVDAAQGEHRKMKHFTIDAENNITLHGSRKAARQTHADVFSTEEQFADLIGSDSQRLLEIWNSLPGVKAVTKFTNRKLATERIWKAIQGLGENAATPPVAQVPDGPDVEAPTARAKFETFQNTTGTETEPVAHRRPTLRRSRPSRGRRPPGPRNPPRANPKPRLPARAARPNKRSR